LIKLADYFRHYAKELAAEPLLKAETKRQIYLYNPSEILSGQLMRPPPWQLPFQSQVGRIDLEVPLAEKAG
jgi:hypothetical protein